MSKRQMAREEMNRLNFTPIENYITEDFGEIGTPSCNELEAVLDAFILGEKLNEERRKAGLTREELAQKVDTKNFTINLYL